MVMMVKVGRGPNGLLPGEGVHYHMQIAEKVEFIARDPQRQEIAWVRVTDGKGKTREYELEGKPLSAEERSSLPVRTMECIDCHSRPAHRFPSATDSVNRALEGGLLPRDLPSIKAVAVQALDGGYATTPAALEGIDRHLREYYEKEHPELLKERGEAVEASIATLRKIYQRTIFPEMKADWRAYPDNSGTCPRRAASAATTTGWWTRKADRSCGTARPATRWSPRRRRPPQRRRPTSRRASPSSIRWTAAPSRSSCSAPIATRAARSSTSRR
jgi:hypothetical protein